MASLEDEGQEQWYPLAEQPEQQQPEEDNSPEIRETPETLHVPEMSEEVFEGAVKAETQDAAPDAASDVELLQMQLPPEAQGEANGGPLGCCLGVVAGIFLTALIITAVSVVLRNGGYLNFGTLPILLIGAIVCGYFGWKIGKKVYREYETPVVKDRRRSAKPRARRV